jgi:hypothetical protein
MTKHHFKVGKQIFLILLKNMKSLIYAPPLYNTLDIFGGKKPGLILLQILYTILWRLDLILSYLAAILLSNCQFILLSNRNNVVWCLLIAFLSIVYFVFQIFLVPSLETYYYRDIYMSPRISSAFTQRSEDGVDW